MKKLMYLTFFLFLFSCHSEQDQLSSKFDGLTAEEVRSKIKSDRKELYKSFLESPEGQQRIGELIQNSPKKGGGGDATHCNCFYTIVDVEVDLGSAEENIYELWSSTECGIGSTCPYFNAHFNSQHPDCADINLYCADVLDGVYPDFPENFNCLVPIGSAFDINFASHDVNPSCGIDFILGESAITFKITCCDLPADPGSDLNNCGKPSRCYVSDEITMTLAGGGVIDDGIEVTLEGCGCVPSFRL